MHGKRGVQMTSPWQVVIRDAHLQFLAVLIMYIQSVKNAAFVGVEFVVIFSTARIRRGY
jgi:hypothetical protein